MKRFTETEKWRDPWFQKLDRQSRTLWLWLCDRVDNAGVVDICWPICNAETGETFSEDSMGALGDKVERLETGKWWIPKFVHFQFGELSDHSKVHQSVEKLLKNHSLSHRVSHRVYDTPKEKDKDKDKEKDSESKVVEVEIPKSLETPEFLQAWNEWKPFRMKMKACKDWSTLWRKQLQQLSGYGLKGAIESLNSSMAGGYQGLFEPKNNNARNGSKPAFQPQSTESAREAEKQEAIRKHNERLLSGKGEA